MFPKAWCGYRMKYDLRILATQCYYCNINLGGNGAIFVGNFIELRGFDDNEFMSLFEEVCESRLEKWAIEKKLDFSTKLLENYKTIEK
jgi:hypothetical protein